MAGIPEIKQDIIDKILTGGARTMAASVRSILNKILDSSPNYETGGKLFEVEVGYKDGYRPSSAGAFATVDMLGGSGSGNVQQFEVTNPTIISSGGIETWTFPNTLYDKYAQCQIYENATDSRLNSVGNKVTDTEISFIFYNGSDIPANTYRCSVQGVQKEAPTTITVQYWKDSGGNFWKTYIDLTGILQFEIVGSQTVFTESELWQDSSLNKYEVTLGPDGTYQIEGVVSGAAAITSKAWQDSAGTNYLQAIGIDATFNINQI